MEDEVLELAQALVETSHWLYAQGWSPATSSNYSARIDAERIALTTSGKDKGRLKVEDIMVVDLQGQPLSPGKPSAETELHLQLYRRLPDLGAVLHTHSPLATVISRRWAAKGVLQLSGFEILKAFEGISTLEVCVEVPIFPNTQDIPALAQKVDAWMEGDGDHRAYLIEGHGAYTWASNLEACRRHIEALEFLLDCTHREWGMEG